MRTCRTRARNTRDSRGGGGEICCTSVNSTPADDKSMHFFFFFAWGSPSPRAKLITRRAPLECRAPRSMLPANTGQPPAEGAKWILRLRNSGRSGARNLQRLSGRAKRPQINARKLGRQGELAG